MWVGVVSIFPEAFQALRDQGVVARALKRGVLDLHVTTPRDFAPDRHRTVDDRPYGGGPGMLMKAEPLTLAIEAAKRSAPVSVRTLFMSPQGRRLTQAHVEELAREPGLLFLAGRYEGVDERVIANLVDEEISLGDYVVTGGELPTMVVIDALARHLPGTLGNTDSTVDESHHGGLLDCPHYTRPEDLLGQRVPAVLLGGDHEAIRRWRKKMRLARTYERRPDLLAHRALSDEERTLLTEYLREVRVTELRENHA